VRLGTVPYLNAEPLVVALRDRDCFPGVELSSMVPSQLLEALLAGRLDAALVSSAGVLAEEALRILPVGCVAARGRVRSIQVYHRPPLAEVRSLALDSSSRSATALARLLFRCRFGRDPEYLTLPPDLERMLEAADAALLIGDPALCANHRLDAGAWSGPVPSRTDLGAEWLAHTGLPFVYAVWAMPRDRDAARLTRTLRRALDLGLARREQLAAEGARAIAIPEAETRAYLLDTIRYELGPEERAALAHFCTLAREHDVLPEHAAVRFAEDD
jgi:chorismate dehydratase